jgi:membrane fusion protein, adhesin transport system
MNDQSKVQGNSPSNLVLGGRSNNYLAKAILLEEAIPPSFLRTTIKLVAYTVGLFLIWALFAKLDVVALSTGQVMPIGSVKIIQHVDGGRIAAINVSDGQVVKEGEVLMRLNDTEPSAEYETLKAKYWGLFARVERLRALIENRPANFSSVPAEYKTMVVEQQATLKTSLAQVDRLEQEIKILTEVSNIRGELSKEKLATRVQALDAQRNLTLAQAELLRYRRTHMDELNIAANEMVQTDEQLNKMRDRLDRVDVVSPVDGVVQDLKFRTIGGVVPPGAILMNVVPSDGQIQADVRVQPTDIGFVRVGQDARVKIGTYDFMRFGTVDGKVTMVSPYSTLDEKQQPYFKVLISVPTKNLGNDPGKKIDPGMTVQADIVTDRQTVLRYLMRPIYVAFHQGLRER